MLATPFNTPTTVVVSAELVMVHRNERVVEERAREERGGKRLVRIRVSFARDPFADGRVEVTIDLFNDAPGRRVRRCTVMSSPAAPRSVGGDGAGARRL